MLWIRLWKGGAIKGVITESKSGRQAILAERVIDATGDADLAVMSGAPYHKTPKDEMLGVTVMFSCSGVNINRFMEYVGENPTAFKDWRGTWNIKTSGERR